MATYTTIQSTVARGSTVGVSLAAAQAAYAVSGNPIKAGFTFIEWNTASDGSGETKELTDALSANTTVYAIFDEVYTIAYDSNGGSGTIASQTVYASSPTATLSNGSGFTKTGYSLTGWNTAANGSGTSYTLGQTITVSASMTLYAQWSTITYNVTYKYNSGTGTPDYVDTITYAEAQSYVILSDSGCGFVAPSGYELDKWNTAANGSGTDYAVGSTHTISSNLTIYAQWVEITYTISYNNNGGTGTISSQTVTAGSSVTLSDGTGFTKTGYTLASWNTVSDGSGISYTLGQTITPTTDRTLYAIWQEITYDVTYVYNYGTGTPDYVDTITYTEAQSYVMNTAVECSFVPPSGYELSTWNTAANGSGTNYAVGSTHTITANLTVYAIWTTI